MKFERLITIITNLAVVSGMVLVVFDLQQKPRSDSGSRISSPSQA